MPVVANCFIRSSFGVDEQSSHHRFPLGAILVYQLALWYSFEDGLDLNIGLKAFLKAA